MNIVAHDDNHEQLKRLEAQKIDELMKKELAAFKSGASGSGVEAQPAAEAKAVEAKAAAEQQAEGTADTSAVPALNKDVLELIASFLQCKASLGSFSRVDKATHQVAADGLARLQAQERQKQAQERQKLADLYVTRLNSALRHSGGYNCSNYFHVGPRYECLGLLRECANKKALCQVTERYGGVASLENICGEYYSSNYFHVGPRGTMFAALAAYRNHLVAGLA